MDDSEGVPPDTGVDLLYEVRRCVSEKVSKTGITAVSMLIDSLLKGGAPVAYGGILLIICRQEIARYKKARSRRLKRARTQELKR